MPSITDFVEEVIDGEIVRMPPPKNRHGDVVEALFLLLMRQIDPAKVRVRVSQFGLIIRTDPLEVRVPDLAMFHKENVVDREGYIHSAPESVVEVLSPANTRLEREDKLRDYQDLGVPEVWVLSPEARTFEILQLQDGKLRTVSTLREGQIRPLKFPNVVVDAASVWPA
jgi:Uma2 family endonuclease